jgi:predicted regulator of Ras-like GTPase activity (Roadblock/LC7/MglB family)
MRTRFKKRIEDIEPMVTAFLHVTKDGKVLEQTKSEKAPKITAKFLSNSVKLVELACELSSEFNLGSLQTISMMGKKGKLDLHILLHPSSPDLFGIIFTEKPSLEEKIKKAFKGL